MYFFCNQFKNFFSGRNIFLAREVTKIHETFYRGSVDEFELFSYPPKGELTVVISKKYNKKELNIDSELKSLKVLHDANLNHQIDIVPTFMGAHAVPKEYNGDVDSYVDLICDSMIPMVAEQGIAIFNDVF